MWRVYASEDRPGEPVGGAAAQEFRNIVWTSSPWAVAGHCLLRVASTNADRVAGAGERSCPHSPPPPSSACSPSCLRPSPPLFSPSTPLQQRPSLLLKPQQTERTPYACCITRSPRFQLTTSYNATHRHSEIETSVCKHILGFLVRRHDESSSTSRGFPLKFPIRTRNFHIQFHPIPP